MHGETFVFEELLHEAGFSVKLATGEMALSLTVGGRRGSDLTFLVFGVLMLVAGGRKGTDLALGVFDLLMPCLTLSATG